MFILVTSLHHLVSTPQSSESPESSSIPFTQGPNPGQLLSQRWIFVRNKIFNKDRTWDVAVLNPPPPPPCCGVLTTRKLHFFRMTLVLTFSPHLPCVVQLGCVGAQPGNPGTRDELKFHCVRIIILLQNNGHCLTWFLPWKVSFLAQLVCRSSNV